MVKRDDHKWLKIGRSRNIRGVAQLGRALGSGLSWAAAIVTQKRRKAGFQSENRLFLPPEFLKFTPNCLSADLKNRPSDDLTINEVSACGRSAKDGHLLPPVIRIGHLIGGATSVLTFVELASLGRSTCST